MRTRRLSAFLVLGFFCCSILQSFGQLREAVIEKASEAIRRGDYSTAVRLCLEGLKSDPLDYELNFLLGRAYAYAGNYDEAMNIFQKMNQVYPENIDVLLFRARVESWKKNYPAAVAGYQDVLRRFPGNREALIGLAEVASWQGDYQTAISLYGELRNASPEDPDLAFRLGRVYLWQGNYARARTLLGEALRLSPDNADYQRALKVASPRWQDRRELRYEQANESFSDGRPNYADRRLALQFPSRPAGPLVLSLGSSERFGDRDTRVELEFYPRLWRRAYAYVDVAISPRAAHLPQSQFQVEIYQGLSSAWDISLGYRRMNFAARPANIYLGSGGRYIGRCLAFLRWYYTPDEKGTAFSWTANLRAYFSESNFLWFAYGRGSRPYDAVSLEDFDTERSAILLAGVDWRLFRYLRLQLTYARRQGEGLSRDFVHLGLGFVW